VKSVREVANWIRGHIGCDLSFDEIQNLIRASASGNEEAEYRSQGYERTGDNDWQLQDLFSGLAQVWGGQWETIVVLVSPIQGLVVSAPVEQAGPRFVDDASVLAALLGLTRSLPRAVRL